MILCRRDFIVDLDLAYLGEDYAMKPRVWRRLRVSGGVSLPALADKVLTPAMVGGRVGCFLLLWGGC